LTNPKYAQNPNSFPVCHITQLLILFYFIFKQVPNTPFLVLKQNIEFYKNLETGLSSFGAMSKKLEQNQFSEKKKKRKINRTDPAEMGRVRPSPTEPDRTRTLSLLPLTAGPR
jgi:hypothetical protein